MRDKANFTCPDCNGRPFRSQTALNMHRNAVHRPARGPAPGMPPMPPLRVEVPRSPIPHELGAGINDAPRKRSAFRRMLRWLLFLGLLVGGVAAALEFARPWLRDYFPPSYTE